MRKATVGLALGSGAAKGFAHIGVLKALEEAHVPIHVIAGSSMGSLVGAFYATGMRPSFMEGLACTLRFRHWMDLTVPKMGMIVGEKVREMVALLTKNANIEEANLPLAIVATELLKRQRVTFRTGNIANAVRASISIPGVFIPYVTPDGIYVDGGVLDRVPVQAAYDLGANIVIAVDVAASRNAAPPESMLDVILHSLDAMQDQVYEIRTNAADITIVPDVSMIGPSQFGKAKLAIAAGYEATKAMIDEILHSVFGDAPPDEVSS